MRDAVQRAVSYAFSLVFLASFANATTYNCSNISIPGTTAVQLNGINNAGIAVGFYDANGQHNGLMYDTGTGSITTINYPGAVSTQLFTINNNNVVVGTYNNSSGPAGYFTWNAGTFMPITSPVGYNLVSAYGINDNGAVSVLVTSGQSTPLYTYGTINADGSFTPFVGNNNNNFYGPTAGGVNNTPVMLASAYQYGGAQLVTPTAAGAFISFSGGATFAATYAFDLNNLGVVIGYNLEAITHEPPYYEFTYDSNAGTYSELLCQEPTITAQPLLVGINDNGVLVGQAIARPLPGQAQLSLSTTSITFPPTPVGQTSAPVPVTITNTGNQRLDMYEFGSLSYGTTQFDIFRTDTGCFPNNNEGTVSLDPGASCTMHITATPRMQGQTTGTEYFYNSSGTQYSLNLSVTGTVPPPTCTVSSTGTGQASFTFQDTNSGMSSITIFSASNATVNIPSFPSGDTSPVTAAATQTNLAQPGQVTLNGTNVAGASTMCSTSFSGSSGPPQWMTTGGSITGRITVVSNANGTLQAFGRGTDNALWTNAQTSPDGPWGTWTSLGGVLSSDPAAGLNGNGDLEAFVLGSDGSLWTIMQSSPGGSFSGWRGLGESLTGDPAVTTDASGSLHVFATGSDHALWTIAETSPGGSFGGWTSLGGAILHNPAVITNTNGSIEVFVVGTDNGVWHNWTVDAAFDWAGWASLGGSLAGSPAAVLNGANGTAVVSGVGTDSSIWYTAHPSGSGWTPFASLGGSLTSDSSAAFDTNGSIEVFARGTDNGVWYITGAPGAPFSFDNWATLGGTINNGPTARINQDGRIAVFVEGTNTAVWTIEQSSPGSWQ